MALFVFARGGPERSSKAPGSVIHITVPYKQQSAWQRVALGIAGTFFVLMGVAIGVLTLRFMLVLAYSLLR